MNVDRIIALRHKVDSLPQARFDMSAFLAREGSEDATALAVELDLDCGTAGCIAGWACAIWRPERAPTAHLAAEILGLTREQADQLFWARGRDLREYPSLESIPTYKAAWVLDRLAETGEVRW